MNESGPIHNFGPFQLDIEQQVLLRDGRAVEIKPKEFQLLVVLLENSGRVVSKQDLIQQVWPDAFVEDSNLTVSIFKLRKTLDEGRNGDSYIQTVPRRGYRFVPVLEDESRANVGVEAGPARMQSTESQAPPKRSIAVLPFKPIGAKTDEYLGLGMADALITRLSNLRQILVRPTSSVRKYEGAQDPVSVGKELKVEWVLDGSIQKSGKRIRLTVQLVNATEGVLSWAEKFDEMFTDIFGVEDSVSEQVANALVPRLTVEEKMLLAKRYTGSPKAYEFYLRGRYFFEKRTAEGCKKGIEYFGKAIEVDPSYALAYAGVAACYVTLGTLSPSKDRYAIAERSAMNALKIDPNLSEAHVSLGYVKFSQLDWVAAEREFTIAIKLNPNCATAHANYAVYLAERCRHQEALLEIRTAQMLDPLSLFINSQVGSIHYMAKRYEEAVEQFIRVLQVDPDFAIARFTLGYTYEALGKYEEALREYRHSQHGLQNSPEFTACVGRIHALSGNKEKALQAIVELRTLTQTHYVQPMLFALIYAALDDSDEAFHWFEQADAEGDPDLGLLKVDPRLDTLRSDPRFETLLDRVGLSDSPVSPLQTSSS